MEVDRKAGASSYLEAFILIGVALGGSGIVLGVATRYSSSMQGPSVSVSDISISQGSYFAFERLTVANTGQGQISSFTVVTFGAPTTASYCYTITNPATLSVVSSTCPAMATNPRTVSVSYTLPSGSALTVALQLAGTPFAVGSESEISVITSAGASATLEVPVLPA